MFTRSRNCVRRTESVRASSHDVLGGSFYYAEQIEDGDPGDGSPVHLVPESSFFCLGPLQFIGFGGLGKLSAALNILYVFYCVFGKSGTLLIRTDRFVSIVPKSLSAILSVVHERICVGRNRSSARSLSYLDTTCFFLRRHAAHIYIYIHTIFASHAQMCPISPRGTIWGPKVWISQVSQGPSGPMRGTPTSPTLCVPR